MKRRFTHMLVRRFPRKARVGTMLVITGEPPSARTSKADESDEYKSPLLLRHGRILGVFIPSGRQPGNLAQEIFLLHLRGLHIMHRAQGDDQARLPNLPSKHDADLAEMGASLLMTESARQFAEREAAVDYGSKADGVDGVDKFLLLPARADDQPLQADLAGHLRCGIDLAAEPDQHTDQRYMRAAPCRPDGLLKRCRTADVENMIDALVIGQLPHCGSPVGRRLIVDHVVGAEGAHPLQLGVVVRERAAHATSNGQSVSLW